MNQVPKSVRKFENIDKITLFVQFHVANRSNLLAKNILIELIIFLTLVKMYEAKNELSYKT